MAAAIERSAQINYQGARLARTSPRSAKSTTRCGTHWRCLATQSQSVILITVQQQTDADVATMRNSVRKDRPDRAGGAGPDRGKPSHADGGAGRAQIAEDSGHRDLGLTLGTGGQPTAQGELPNPAGRRETLAQLDEAALIETAFRNRKDLQALTRFQEAADETAGGARNGTTAGQSDAGHHPGDGAPVHAARRRRSAGRVNEALAGQSEARPKLQELRAQICRDIGTALAGARQCGFSGRH